MNLKKCGFLLVFAMMFCFVLPSFASAKTVDLLGSKQFYKNYGTGSFYKGNEASYRYLYQQEVVADLGKEFYIKNFTYSARGGIHFAYLSFYDSNFRRIKKVNVEGPRGDFDVFEKARYVGVGNDGRDSTEFSWVSVYGDDGLVSDVSNLKATSEMNKVTLNWKNPEGEENFKGLRIYQGKQIIANLDNKTTSYVVSGLDVSKSYSFTVKSIDQNGGETKGTSVNATTLMPVIKPPENVYITPQDKKIVITWDDVKSPYLQGYNVYVDGKKINDKPLTSNKLIVKNLENDKSYKVQISAVNKNDVEGEKSKEVSEKPSSDALEVEYDVKMPFDPKDVLGVAMAFLLIVGPLILLGLAFKFYKPVITFLYNSIQNKKGRDEK
ncbi:TPA: fibronectin type III domain-containing protein [Bacillus cereus]|nr:fibronectin type III domain-containing protein [Bacillus cereus]